MPESQARQSNECKTDITVQRKDTERVVIEFKNFAGPWAWLV